MSAIPRIDGLNSHAAPPAAPPKTRGRVGWWALGLGTLVLTGFGGLYASGTLPRMQRTEALDAAAASTAAAPPVVATTVARRSPPTSERELPGNCLPLYESSLFARTTGYLSERLVDIGDQVGPDQLLAKISAPDVDDQLAQALANLEQAQANLKLNEANVVLAKITLARDQKAGEAVTPQQIDQDRATVDTTVASVNAAKASIDVNKAAVQRYTDLQSFQSIKAPFKGVITLRNYDKGALITADDPTTLPLFRLAQIDVVRVFVNVPQVYVSGIKIGQDAKVYRRENPQQLFTGKVTRTASALDPATRTMQTEVDVQNPDGVLLPGMYLQVKFASPRGAETVLIPSAAVNTRAQGSFVGVLDAGDTVHYVRVQLGRDFGADIEVIDGLSDGDTVLVRPGDELPEGTVVQRAASPNKNK
jgi:RND family efflux transporter MFP subunit